MNTNSFDLIKEGKEIGKNIYNQGLVMLQQDNGNVIIYSTILLITLFIVLYMLFMPKCTNTVNENNDKVNCSSAITSGNTDYTGTMTVKDFYIKSAYNCCNVGDYKNCYVNSDMLKYIIRQGVRGLDFAIYSIDGQPVVASSSNKDNTKTSLNYIKFSEVLGIVARYAFASGTAPNSADPIFMNLRIYSTNKAMYDNLISIITSSQYSSLFLSPHYSWADGDDNFGNCPFKNLQGKIVLILENNSVCKDDTCSMYEYVNIVSDSAYMHKLNNFNVVNTPDSKELIAFNKQYMSLVTPDVGDSPANPDSVVAFNYGCQMVAMRYQLNDDLLRQYNKAFNDVGHAFILKPEKLRETVYVKPIPKSQTVDYTATQNVLNAAGDPSQYVSESASKAASKLLT